MRPPARLAAAAMVFVLLVGEAYAQSTCGFDRLGQLPQIEATCCESTSAKDCSAGFPKTCTLACAKVIVPFYNACGRMLKSMPKNNLKFGVRAMKEYVENCEHAQELFHYSKKECAASEKDKQQRVLDVTQACCHQGGAFVCQNGVSWKCNAECATAYVPFYDDCLKRDGGAVGVAEMQKYNKLYEECANLPEKEVGVLLSDLNDLISNPKCHVNTTGIQSRGGKFALPAFKGPGTCKDDNKGLAKMYAGQTCLKAAASKSGCKYPKVSDFCGCSCKVQASKGTIACVDDNDGLRKMGYTGLSCLNAASSTIGCSMSGVANLCQCSCSKDQHRRRAQAGPAKLCSKLQKDVFTRCKANCGKCNVPNVETILGSCVLDDGSQAAVNICPSADFAPKNAMGLLAVKTTCPWDTFDDKMYHVSRLCCPNGGCKNKVPSGCSFDCGAAFGDLMFRCGASHHRP